MNEVTDPGLLAQLNASEPVTDEELLKKLNDGGGDEPGVLGTGLDVAASAGAGAGKGLIEGVGTMHTLADLTAAGGEYAGMDPNKAKLLGKVAFPLSNIRAFDPERLKAAVDQITGWYKPKTHVGEYAGKAGEFAGNPLSYLGPGGLPLKAGIAIAGGLGAQAGEDVSAEEYKPLGGLVGSILSTLGASGAVALARNILNYAKPALRTLPGDVPITSTRSMEGAPRPGKATTLMQEQEEEALASGARGYLPQRVMEKSRLAREADIAAEEAKIGESLGPASTRTNEEVGDVFSSAFKAEGKKAEDIGNAFYESAREKNAWAVAGEHRPSQIADTVLQNSGFPDADISGLSGANRAYKLIQGLEKGIPSDEMNMAVKAGAPSINAAPALGSQGQPRLMSFNKMFSTRNQLSKIVGDTASDANAVKAIKSAFDDWMTTTVENNLFYGDKTAVQDMFSGHKEWTRYHSFIDTKKRPGMPGDVQSIIGRISSGKENGDNVANWLTNVSSVGGSARAAKVVGFIKDKFPADEANEMIQILQQGVWNKVARPTEIVDGRLVLTTKGQKGDVATAKFIREMVNERGAPLFRALYDDKTRKGMLAYADALIKTNPKLDNPSRSALSWLRNTYPLTQGLLGLVGSAGMGLGPTGEHGSDWKKVLAAGFVLPFIRSGINVRRALQATTNMKRSPSMGATAVAPLLRGANEMTDEEE